MALGFFRRHQRMVVIVMVVLMFSFLVGYTGIQMIVGDNQPQTRVVARLDNAPDITGRMLQLARQELDFLSRGPIYLGQEQVRAQIFQLPLEDQAFRLLRQQNPDNFVLAYAVLKQQLAAEDQPVTVTEQEVDAFFQKRGLSGASYESFIGQARENRLSEDDVRGMVANWLRVTKLARAAVPASVPSEPELRQMFRSRSEQINVRLTRLPIEPALDEVGEPNDAQIRELYEAHKDTVRGTVTEDNPFGLGYREPHKIALSYLLVNRTVIEQAVEPTRDELWDHYKGRKTRYTAEPQDPNDPNAEPRQLSFVEARPRIRADVAPKLAQEHIEAYIRQIETLGQEYVDRQAQGQVDKPLYWWVAEQLYSDAQPWLDRSVDLNIQDAPLTEALERIAKAGGLKAIVYPTGRYRGAELDPNLRVNIRAGTVGEALEQIGAETQWTPQEWLTASNLPGVLFPVFDQFHMTPVEPGRAGPMPLDRLALHPLLRSARTSEQGDGRSLRAMVSDLVQQQTMEEASAANAGTGAPLYVSNNVDGRLYWQLTETIPPQAPKLADNPALRQQVIDDWKRIQAMQLAEKKAKEVASVEQLEQFVDQQGLQSFETGMVSRQPFQQHYQLLLQLGLTGEAMGQGERVLDAAFSLAPEKPGQAPTEEDPVAVVSLPAADSVLLLQRTDYRAPVEDNYQSIRPKLVEEVRMVQQLQALGVWLQLDNVGKRVGGISPEREEPAT